MADDAIDPIFRMDDAPEGSEHVDDEGRYWKKVEGEWVILGFYRRTPDPNGAHGI